MEKISATALLNPLDGLDTGGRVRTRPPDQIVLKEEEEKENENISARSSPRRPHHRLEEEELQSEDNNAHDDEVEQSGKNNREQKQQDESSSPCSSILSWGRTDEWYEDDESSSSEEEEDDDDERAFRSKWDALERELQKRQALLNRIVAVGLRPAVARQLQEREEAVARLKRLDLLNTQVELMNKQEARQTTNRTTTDDDNKKDSYFWNVMKETMSSEKKEEDKHQKRSHISSFRDTLSFELCFTLPAVVCLILHSIAMSSIYECISACVLYVWQKASIYWATESVWLDLAFFGSVFVVAVAILRTTGYLYWWLPNVDYDCLKFDYHNRLRLQNTNARIMRAVRTNPIVCMLVYFVGYNLCYMATAVLYHYIEFFFDQKDTLLRGLPSTHYPWHFESTPSAEAVLCARTCQEEIDLQEELFEQTKRADQAYLSTVLSPNSQDCYWSMWVHDQDYIEDNPPLFSVAGELCLHFGTLLVGVVVLRVYGFLFWEWY